MPEHLITKRYENHYGLDLKSDDLTRDIRFASGMKNAQYRKSGGIEARPGFHRYGASAGGYGEFTYNRTDPTTGAETPFVVGVDRIPYLLSFSVVTITYSGSNAPASGSVFFDVTTNQYRLQLTDGSLVLDQALGLGTETIPYTLAELQTAINAVTNFSCSITGSTSTPAAFLKIVRDHDMSESGSDLTTQAAYWAPINTTVTYPFSGSYDHRNDDDFENVSAAQLNNCLYLSNGYDPVQKYDGQTCYNAGLPTPSELSSPTLTAGAISGSNYQWIIHYTQVDAVGQVIEGNYVLSPVSSTLASKQAELTLPSIEAGSGFNTNCALVNGNQTGVTTITVSNSPHTMKVGDTAYFLDRSSSAWVERLVTATTSTSITISGDPVDVSSADVISNNLRITIWRSKDSGSTPVSWYLVDEISNNSFASTQTYVDNKADTDLGAQFIIPLTDRTAPPRGKYLCTFGNNLVVGGILAAPNTVFLNDVDGAEYFPNDGSTSFDCYSPRGDVVAGLAENNSVLSIFNSHSIHIAVRNADGSISRVDNLTNDIGCAAHATIHEIKGALAWLDERGPYTMVGGQLPLPLGQITDPQNGRIYGRLEPVFDQRGVSDENLLVVKKAVAVNHAIADKYILFVPAESSDGSGNLYSNSNSVIFAYDYSRDAWLQWSNMNMEGGATVLDNELLWQERTLDNTVTSYLYRQHNLNDAWDYQDNENFLDWTYDAQWEALDYPSVLKRCIRMKIFQLEETPNNSPNIRVQIETNYVKDVPHSDFYFTQDVGGYGNTSYGTDPYGDPAETNPDHKLGGGRFKSFRVRFSNQTPQQNSIINGWELDFVTPYKLQMKHR